MSASILIFHHWLYTPESKRLVVLLYMTNCVTREKLQKYLRKYDKYSVNLILGRVERDEWLYPEAAILHGKVGKLLVPKSHYCICTP